MTEQETLENKDSGQPAADRQGEAQPAADAKFKLAILVSGTGSNLQAIIDKLHDKVANIQVAVVISNVPGVLAIERAERADIPTAVYQLEDYQGREERDLAIAEAIEAAGADLVVLAGWMHMLTPSFVRRFTNRIINLHPALLPAFPGTRAIADAIEYGVKVTGVSVIFVDEGVDTGPVIRQESIAVRDDDGVGSLAERIHALEHRVLPRTIELIARGKVTPPPPGSRLVRVDDSEPSQIAD